MTKEFGTQILKFQRISRHFSVIKRSRTTYKDIGSLLQTDDILKPKIVTKAVYQLVKCLNVLHSSSLVIGDLSTNNVCLGVVKGKVTGDVQIEKEPQIANTSEDAQDEMFNVGKIVRVMLSKCQQSNN